MKVILYLAEASDAIVIAFNVRPSLQASKLADNAGIEIKMYSIIYNAIEEVKSAMEGMLEPKVQEKIVANVEIREVFKFDKATVAGCTVRDGKIKRDSKIRLIRDGIVIYPTGDNSAELGSLKRFKDDAKEVLSGMECGLTIKNFTDYKVGDVVEAYEIEEVKRTLSNREHRRTRYMVQVVNLSSKRPSCTSSHGTSHLTALTNFC